MKLNQLDRLACSQVTVIALLHTNLDDICNQAEILNIMSHQCYLDTTHARHVYHQNIKLSHLLK